MKQIEYKQVDRTYFPQYDRIPMRLWVSSCYRMDKIDRGLGGFALVEVPVAVPYCKDFCIGNDEHVSRWERWDITHWAFFMAFDGARPVGAATVASRTQGVNMLAGRDDLAVLWDLRVDEAYKRRGIGQKLMHMALDWSREQGLQQMKIECQNTNVPACKFYHKQGAVLSEVNEYAYYHDLEQFRHEIQLIWFINL